MKANEPIEITPSQDLLLRLQSEFPSGCLVMMALNMESPIIRSVAFVADKGGESLTMVLRAFNRKWVDIVVRQSDTIKFYARVLGVGHFSEKG